MLLELLSRIAPHVPLALHQHRPERAPPTAGELTRLDAISRLEAIDLGGELSHGDAAGAAPLGGTAPWVRACAGAPEGVYTLSGLSARSRVYRYDADTPDAFKPHYDEVWPGSSLRLGGQGSGSNVVMYDGWRYSSDAQPHGHSALAWRSCAARVDAQRARGPPARPGLPSGPERSPPPPPPPRRRRRVDAGARLLSMAYALAPAQSRASRRRWPSRREARGRGTMATECHTSPCYSTSTTTSTAGRPCCTRPHAAAS